MTPSTAARVSLAVAVLAGALSHGATPFDVRVAAQSRAAMQAPIFEVDPLWPKPLPNHWVLGSTIGVSVDARDHVWILHRPETVDDNFKAAAFTPPIGTCCMPAPPVLEFDQAGNLVGHWGGPGQGYEWPESNHGITIDHKGHVWIGGNGPTDAHVLKFSPAGKVLLQIGHQGKTSGGGNDTENLWRAAKIFVDPASNEAYIADGYGNHRVIVFDAMVDGVNEKVRIVLRSTLEVLTSFGDGGRQPGQFFGVHNVATDSKGNLYTTETYTGARLQRFIYKGLGPVGKTDQGVPWPRPPAARR